MNEDSVRQQLRSWIAERAHLSSAKELEDDTQILEQGLISSLDVVELMLFIESILEEEIDADDIEPDVFQSIDRLYEHFFSQGND
ncbi:MAG: acyl carrier protein [Planctomycetota bacterium]